MHNWLSLIYRRRCPYFRVSTIAGLTVYYLYTIAKDTIEIEFRRTTCTIIVRINLQWSDSNTIVQVNLSMIIITLELNSILINITNPYP